MKSHWLFSPRGQEYATNPAAEMFEGFGPSYMTVAGVAWHCTVDFDGLCRCSDWLKIPEDAWRFQRSFSDIEAEEKSRSHPFLLQLVAAGFLFFLNTYIIITIIFVLLLLSYTTSWHWHQLAMCSLPKLADGVMKWLDKWWMQMCSSKWVRHVETTTLEIAKNRVTYCELRHRFIYHNRSGS